MKGIVLKLKRLTHKTGDLLSKHSVTLYFSLFLAVLFSSAWVSQKVSYEKELKQVRNENSLLITALDDYEVALGEYEKWSSEQLKMIQKQAEIIQKYENTLQYAKDALEDQSKLIKDLINYLKKIDHWPPKEPRPIPEQPNRSWAIYEKENYHE